ncbi:MAG: HAD family hydrolase [Candidatus Abyssobacteria bacterium SURF_5]|uniref:HAD family hydrolase n=1 Tax=Abyssobacteria bacterium (strain SURF_5) TaxID=2093360 RepID=A0A3A4N9M8_ABYX5|nr:MAG: HAD family hydrolase [Candidatus Abyssubacteria bacterium SURF_5]
MNRSVIEYAEQRSRGRTRVRKYPIIPANIPQKLPKLVGIGAVLWDVYGTLLGHPMGDVVEHSLMEKSTKRAFIKTAAEYGLEKFLGGDPATVLRKLYDDEIEKIHRRKRAQGVFSPEVKIEEVWLRILRQLEGKGYISGEGPVDMELALKVAYYFDDAQQFKVLYPGARRTLEMIRKKGLRQGIVSNAQFYTPITLNILLRNSVSVAVEAMDELFDHDLVVFSYALGVGKPNPSLYEKARDRLIEMGIEPSRVIHVGNDMLYDAVLARKVGFKAVFFAGDRRSVTLRKDDPEASGFEPDAVIKSLPQLIEILA